MDFSYILEKIKNAEFLTEPFKHIEINNLFKEGDFKKIIESQEIATKKASSDDELIDILLSQGYEVVNFFGATVDRKKYVEWHKDKDKKKFVDLFLKGFQDLDGPANTLDRLSFLDLPREGSSTLGPLLTINSAGMVFRLKSQKSEAMVTLKEFFNSEEWCNCIAEKFNIDRSYCSYDFGVQKYLDGYGMKPHPDVRQKTLTFLMNINPNPSSIDEDHHTSLFKFKPEWKYVQRFWEENPSCDRSWVPWDWCEKVKVHNANNSIIFYVPSNDTLHGVKTNYDHKIYQRTQLYGNMLYHASPATSRVSWQDLSAKGDVK